VRGAKAGALRHYTAADQRGRQARAIAKDRMARRIVPWEYEHEPTPRSRNAHRAGYQIAVIETSSDAVSLFDWAPAWPVCVVLSERTGWTRRRSGPRHARAHPSSAPNVAQRRHGRGVVLYELQRRHRKLTN
jgi:hypothetical protein